MLMALVIFALLGPSFDQEKPTREVKPPQRGDTVVARGCLSGGTFDSSEVTGRDKDENETRYAEFATFRLTGDKKVLQDIRKAHSGHVDVLHGELRTDLPRARGSSGVTIGNSRITVGVGRGMAPEPPPPLPVLKVTSFEHTGITCR
jgi:hypothetical protein